MAEKQYLDYAGLKEYDERIKAWVEALPKGDPAQIAEIQTELADLKELVGDKEVAQQIDEAIAALVDSAPEALDTLKEIAQ